MPTARGASTVLSWVLLLLVTLIGTAAAAAAAPAASTLVGQIIDLDDDTPAGAVIDNLDRRLNLRSNPAAWLALKIMNPPDGPGSDIIDGLSINASSAELYANRRLDRDDLCRQPAGDVYGQRRQRRKRRHPCCDVAQPCELSLSVAHLPGDDGVGGGGVVGPTVLTELSLRLRDENDNRPKFAINSATLQVAEGDNPGSRLSPAGGTSTVVLLAEDPDQGANGLIDYRLTGSGAATEDLPFRLERGGDVGFRRLSLVTNRMLDREEKDRYLLQLLAVDGGKPQLTGTLSLTVLVTDINDEMPTFEQRVYQVRVAEDAPIGSLVATVLAKDKDVGPNGIVDYQLSGGQHAALFRVARSSDGRGIVSLARRLDAESAKLDPSSGEAVLELLLVAKDRGSPTRSSEARLLVTVLDVNDETPEVTVIYMSSDPQRLGRGLLPENSPTSIDVARVHASDADSGQGGEVDCRLRGGGDSPEADDAILAGGFVLVDVASPSGRSQRDRTFTLRSTRPLDREQRSTLELTVVCADRGHPPTSLTGSAVVRLRIIDENDNAPRFQLPPSGTFQFRLPENEPSAVGQRRSIGFVRAKDVDEEPNNRLTFALVAPAVGSIGEGAFEIDANSGELFAVRPFDREDPRLLTVAPHAGSAGSAAVRSVAQVSVQVTVRDSNPTHTDTANVLVTIEDRNDNAPRFESAHYNFRAAEEAADYRIVGSVSAADPDESDSANIEYRIDKDAEHEVRRLFRLDQNSGAINLLDKLDREARASYEFRVLAVDGKHSRGGEGPGVRNTGTATVTIEVIDVNDCKPRFLQPADGQVLKLPVGATAGYSLIEAKAVDDDLNENGRVTYSLIDASNSGLEIDRTTGTLFVIKPVSRIIAGQPEQFSLTLSARDNGSPISLSSTVRVWVRIVDSAHQPVGQGDAKHSGVNSGNIDSGKDSSYSASHRMRATVVIGLIAFFFLLLILASAAAVALLRPCRPRRLRGDASRGDRFGGGGGVGKNDDEGHIDQDAADEATLKEAGGRTVRQLTAGTLRCSDRAGAATAEHYNLIQTLGHSIDGATHQGAMFKSKGKFPTVTSSGKQHFSTVAATSNCDYQMLRMHYRPDCTLLSQQQQQQQQHTYYQISSTMRRGEADGGLSESALQQETFNSEPEGTTQPEHQQQQQETPTARRNQRPYRRQQNRPAFDLTGGASFV